MRVVRNSKGVIGELGHVLAVTATSGFCVNVQPPTGDSKQVDVEFAFTNVKMNDDPILRQPHPAQPFLPRTGEVDLQNMVCSVKMEASEAEKFEGASVELVKESYWNGWQTTEDGNLKHINFLDRADAKELLNRICRKFDLYQKRPKRENFSVGELPECLHELTGNGFEAMRTWISYLRSAGLSEQLIAFEGSRMIRGMSDVLNSDKRLPRTFRGFVRTARQSVLKPPPSKLWKDDDPAAPCISTGELKKLSTELKKQYGTDFFAPRKSTTTKPKEFDDRSCLEKCQDSYKRNERCLKLGWQCCLCTSASCGAAGACVYYLRPWETPYDIAMKAAPALKFISQGVYNSLMGSPSAAVSNSLGNL